jgi:hypothetical protein
VSKRNEPKDRIERMKEEIREGSMSMLEVLSHSVVVNDLHLDVKDRIQELIPAIIDGFQDGRSADPFKSLIPKVISNLLVCESNLSPMDNPLIRPEHHERLMGLLEDIEKDQNLKEVHEMSRNAREMLQKRRDSLAKPKEAQKAQEYRR